MKLSGIIITKNEEGNIQSSIRSLDFCNEVIIVDDYSQDKTAEISKKFGVKVYQRKLNADFSAQRNFGLKKAKGEWVLFIDADEVVSGNLKNEILSAIIDKKINGYYLKRTDYFMGRKLSFGETRSIKLLRLARKGKGKWTRRVHETWNVKENVQTLKSPLLHHPHINLASFIKNIDQFSSLHAQENAKEHKHASIFKIILWPFLKFLQNYLLKLGFLDGVHGFVHAVFMSFHSYLSWSKLWLTQKETS